MTDLAQAKAELRLRMRRRRDALGARDRDRMVAAIHERLVSLPRYADSRSILLFYSFGSEVATDGLVARALQEGKQVLLPYLEDATMEAAEVRPGDTLVPTRYGPKEPGRRVPVDPADVDLVVTPGLAFDRRGRRLGYGAAHYDRYLGRLRPEASRVGIAFGLQVVDEVPAGPDDERVHLLVTEAEVIDCR